MVCISILNKYFETFPTFPFKYNYDNFPYTVFFPPITPCLNICVYNHNQGFLRSHDSYQYSSSSFLTSPSVNRTLRFDLQQLHSSLHPRGALSVGKLAGRVECEERERIFSFFCVCVRSPPSWFEMNDLNSSSQSEMHTVEMLRPSWCQNRAQ